jgi:cell division protein FtsB
MGVKVRNRIFSYFGWFGVLFGFYLIYVLSKGIVEMRGLGLRLNEAEMKLSEEKGRRVLLLEQLAEATSSAYVEKVAREELGMSLPGETVVVVSGGNSLGMDEEGDLGEEVPKNQKKNWQKWWDLVR